jgi:DNA-directed RNA polymerase specialized sigma24 family protein
MSSAQSVTHWIRQLQAGDREAAQHLWERYFHQLVTLARNRLRGVPRAAADEEDVALSAFDSFYRRAEQGQFPHLHDRQDLWQLLVVITLRKAIGLRRHERRTKRGGGTALHEGGMSEGDSSADGLVLAEVISREPDPEFAAQVTDNFEHLLNQLGDARLQSVAVLKMEGWTIEEIAAKVSCVPRTVDRRLRLIRRIWVKEITP